MEFHLPELGEGVYEAEMSRWLVREGDKVRPGQGLLEVLTDKATMEVPAPFAGNIESFRVHEGEKIKVGDVVLTYEEAMAPGQGTPAGRPTTPVAMATPPAPPAVQPQTAALAPSQPGNGAAEPVKAAPSVRVLARRLGVDLSQVKGSGPGGRILIDDVTKLAPVAEAPKPPESVESYGTPGTRVKLKGLRRMIAAHMVHAKKTIPHYTYVDEADVTELVRVRDGLRAASAAKDVKITYLPFIVRAAVQALKDVPLVNATLDDAAGDIILHDRYHIGVATATPGGLLVPVVHDADRVSFMELARTIDRLAAAARAGKSKREDLLGGTFTITSISNIGGLFATPIIHHPQLAILGIGKIVKRPVIDAQGQVRAADMVYLSFSFDHRVLDGAIGTAFGNALIKHLSNPVGLLVD